MKNRFGKISSREGKGALLMNPGPVHSAESVKRAAIAHEICHREPEFSDLLKRVEDGLIKLLDIRQKSLYRAVFLTGSGSAANESVLSSIVGEGKVLVLSNGEFGERLYKVSKLHNERTIQLKFYWGEPMNIQLIESLIISSRVDVVAMVHHETSTGMLNPIEEVGAICKAHGEIFFVDAVSSVGADKIDVETANIDFLTGSSSKAIASLPGISFVLGKRTQFERLKEIKAKTAYLNLYKHYRFLEGHLQTPNTPAVNILYALEAAIGNILRQGAESRINHTAELAKRLRRGLKRLSLDFLIDEEMMSSVVTTVKVPSYIDFTTLARGLKEKGIVIYGGKGLLKDRIFQIGTIGEIDSSDIDYFLDSLGEILKIYIFPDLAIEGAATGGEVDAAGSEGNF